MYYKENRFMKMAKIINNGVISYLYYDLGDENTILKDSNYKHIKKVSWGIDTDNLLGDLIDNEENTILCYDNSLIDLIIETINGLDFKKPCKYRMIEKGE